jgi:ClpP class serine protease
MSSLRSSLLLNTPLALLPAHASAMLVEMGASLAKAPPEWSGPGYEVVGGVAVIEVHGLLLQRTGSLRSWGYCTGYDGIRANVIAALNDPAVQAIAFDVDSPGGECNGLFDLADLIFAARSLKPSIAICSEHAYSAAYALASAASVITVPRSGGVGSIGVITVLVDRSKMLTDMGLAVHFVVFGSDKAVAGRAEITGMSKEALASVQEDVDRLGELFVATVARNRGTGAGAVRATKAACFMGEIGVDAGLADVVASPDEAFAAFLTDVGAV